MGEKRKGEETTQVGQIEKRTRLHPGREVKKERNPSQVWIVTTFRPKRLLFLAGAQ